MAAIASIHHSLVSPKKVDQGFEEVAKGAYEKDGILYLRDCLLVNKFVVKQGSSETASSPEVALKDAVENLLPKGKYRCFKADGRFEHITIGGQAILQGGNVSEWDMALALPEHVKEDAGVVVQVAKDVMGG